MKKTLLVFLKNKKDKNKATLIKENSGRRLSFLAFLFSYSFHPSSNL